MDLIEQAAKRLEELRRAGAAEPNATATVGAAETAPATEKERVPTPEAFVRGLDGRDKVTLRTPAAPKIDGVSRKGLEQPAAEVRTPARKFELDLEALRLRGFVTPDAPKSQIAEEFRIIKRPVLGKVRGQPGVKIANGNLIMVTSSLPGEGKTFTAINLALSIAMEVDTTVLLVDGDVAHPGVPGVLGIPNSPGLLEILTRDDVDFADALLRTNVANLSILPAGSHHRRATELLASEQMALFLRELATRYSDRIIIFDSPPLLATTEARVLATHMGQIIMVVAADSTRQHAVNLALATLESCPNVQMMLNKAEKTEVGTYYVYYADDAP